MARPTVVTMPDRRRYPHRLTCDLDPAQFTALRNATKEDDVAAAFRIRALIQHWIDNDDFRASINARAAELRDHDQEVRYRKSG